MRQQYQVALRKFMHQFIAKPTGQSWACGGALSGTKLFPRRNYSKFSTHLSTERAMELICNLDKEERSNLRNALGKIDAEKEKKFYERNVNFISTSRKSTRKVRVWWSRF
ncbi:uncharacterized protein LOC108113291 [Drosophila eugracilis]|uniref:uncharacterized protein LOC108113291 n=1 Tax=Drosophila eugracilis TaxID=29029 RepID=UPI001BD93781|nr:uncharacterized protein LOC108113291 [Drosophila eugracilis]